MKSESLVIAGQHIAVNVSLKKLVAACQVFRVGLGLKLEHFHHTPARKTGLGFVNPRGAVDGGFQEHTRIGEEN